MHSYHLTSQLILEHQPGIALLPLFDLWQIVELIQLCFLRLQRPLGHLDYLVVGLRLFLLPLGFAVRGQLLAERRVPHEWLGQRRHPLSWRRLLPLPLLP